MARDEKYDRQDGLDRFDRIISQRLAAERDTGGAQCPDVSIIAAYRMGALGGSERSLWEHHFARCARCAGTFAALARIDEKIESPDAAPGRTVAKDDRAWWRPRVAFPIAAFGVAVLLIVVVIKTMTAERDLKGGQGQSKLESKQLLADAGGTGAVASAPSKSVGMGALSGGNQEMAMNDAARTQAANEPLGAKASPLFSAARSKARERLRSSPRDDLMEKSGRAADSDKDRMEAAAVAPAVPPPPVAASASTSAPGGGAPSVLLAPVPAPAQNAPPPAKAEGTRVPGTGEFASGTAGVSGASPTASSDTTTTGTAPGGIPATVSGANSAVVAPMRATSGVEVTSPNHATTWMVDRHGAISRYDSGNGWSPQVSGVTVDLVAGSAPSGSVCWVVGRAGTILRTRDGNHWTKISAPVADDLTGVVANDANRATITDVDGRHFSTLDGGLTWHQM